MFQIQALKIVNQLGFIFGALILKRYLFSSPDFYKKFKHDRIL